MVFNATTKAMQYCNGQNWINTGASVPSATNTGCTSPTGPAGGVIYNGALGVVQFCNGQNWVDTACATTRSPNGPGCTSPTGKAGDIIFETTSAEAQFCDSTNWVAMGWPCASGGLTDWSLATQMNKFYAGNTSANLQFGYSMAASGNTLAVGAFTSDGSGAVYIFTRNGNAWTQQAMLTSSFPQANSRFGSTLVLEGDTLIVGQPYWDNMSYSRTDVGKVFAYTRTGGVWTQQTEFGGVISAFSYYGGAIALSGDTVILGYSASSNPYYLVFTRSGDTWTSQPAPAAGNSQSSGYGMALAGDTAFTQGSHYIRVFQRSGTDWNLEATIPVPDESSGLYFNGMHATKDTILAAIPYDYGPAYLDGSVYIFKKVGGTWTKQARLTPPELSGTNLYFGIYGRLSPDGKTAFIRGTSSSNKVFVFQETNGTWAHQTTITGADSITDDNFGISFALLGNNTLAVGAHADDDNGHTNSGSVYVFTAP